MCDVGRGLDVVVAVDDGDVGGDGGEVGDDEGLGEGDGGGDGELRTCPRRAQSHQAQVTEE